MPLIEDIVFQLKENEKIRSFVECKELLETHFSEEAIFIMHFCHLSFAHDIYDMHKQRDWDQLEMIIDDLVDIYSLETINNTNTIWSQVLEEPKEEKISKRKNIGFLQKTKGDTGKDSSDQMTEDPVSSDESQQESSLETEPVLPPAPEAILSSPEEILESVKTNESIETPVDDAPDIGIPKIDNVKAQELSVQEAAEESESQEQPEIDTPDDVPIHSSLRPGTHTYDFYPEKRIFGVQVPQHGMLRIEPGIFQMGNAANDPYASFEAKPAHQVEITNAFWIAAYPCAQLLYDAVMPNKPSHFRQMYNPVENISWCAAIWFCNEMSKREGLVCAYETPARYENSTSFARNVYWNRSANGYRLPTEAEWEYVARAGIHERFSGAENTGQLKDVAWFKDNSRQRTHLVGDKKPNNWGLYDMTGNVYEWVWDTKERPYSTEKVVDPVYEDGDRAKRMFRGGSWNTVASMCSISYRRWSYADIASENKGIRLVRNIDD